MLSDALAATREEVARAVKVAVGRAPGTAEDAEFVRLRLRSAVL